MKIRILRDTIAEKRLVLAGSILDVSAQECQLLIAAHKAEMVKDSPVERAVLPTAPVAMDTTNAAVLVETEMLPIQKIKRKR